MWRLPRDGRWIASRDHPRGELPAEPPSPRESESACKEMLHEARGSLLDLALSEREEAQDLHAPGQRVGKLRHEQHVGRAGEEKAARFALPVDRDLERGEESGHSLHFVENHARRQLGDESGRVALCRGTQEVLAVQAEGAFEVELAVPEAMIRHVEYGQAVTVTNRPIGWHRA